MESQAEVYKRTELEEFEINYNLCSQIHRCCGPIFSCCWDFIVTRNVGATPVDQKLFPRIPFALRTSIISDLRTVQAPAVDRWDWATDDEWRRLSLSATAVTSLLFWCARIISSAVHKKVILSRCHNGHEKREATGLNYQPDGSLLCKCHRHINSGNLVNPQPTMCCFTSGYRGENLMAFIIFFDIKTYVKKIHSNYFYDTFYFGTFLLLMSVLTF